ncbi:YbaB/EbfC family nucleoid-associated protein [Nocardia sp. NBC_01503]|uniref:YbaB/EbfC family nucleoid-associated protein n=1 Tax=Nocardia sp. NBC_01503 TaxID=2975997 RepID=UPI002E7C20C5|nr:YbaB/EbfC family nucleoid-associated protein [Nocardia sp. NBC_01503]WTL33956.1 YbaB/EbfC family nucleoid-associated protein [Nocardia sp. NBC_01503]
MNNNERARNDLSDILEGFADQMRTITQLQRERAALTATATVRQKRVTVTVNAEGTVIETKFSADIEDLDYPEIAKAVTEAAQQAAAEVARRGREVLAPVSQNRNRLPKLADLVPGMPDLSRELRVPEPPVVSTAPPKSPERTAAQPIPEPDPAAAPRRGAATDSGW